MNVHRWVNQRAAIHILLKKNTRPKPTTGFRSLEPRYRCTVLGRYRVTVFASFSCGVTAPPGTEAFDDRGTGLLQNRHYHGSEFLAIRKRKRSPHFSDKWPHERVNDSVVISKEFDG